MTTVGQLLRGKGTDIHSIGPDDMVHEALQRMAEKNVGALLVLDGDQLVGIMSERDYARKVVLEAKTSVGTPVRDIMTTKVMYVRRDQTVEECMALMTDKRVRHVPVMEGGKVLGVISIGDVVKSIISKQEFLLEQLASYITGG